MTAGESIALFFSRSERTQIFLLVQLITHRARTHPCPPHRSGDVFGPLDVHACQARLDPIIAVRNLRCSADHNCCQAGRLTEEEPARLQYWKSSPAVANQMLGQLRT